MTRPAREDEAVIGETASLRVTVHWAAETNEQGLPTRWLGSWLIAGDGVEGDWFYSGHGGERTDHDIPQHATGIRVRKWTSEGLDPEYVDVMLDGAAQVRTDALDFDAPQPHRVPRLSSVAGNEGSEQTGA